MTTLTRDEQKNVIPNRTKAFGAVAVAASLAFTLLQTWPAGSQGFQLRELAVVCGVIAVAAPLIFLIWVPRIWRGHRPAGTSIILAALGLLTVPLHLGLSPLLAGAAILLGVNVRRSQPSLRALLGITLGVLVLIAQLTFQIGDWMAPN